MKLRILIVLLAPLTTLHASQQIKIRTSDDKEIVIPHAQAFQSGTIYNLLEDMSDVAGSETEIPLPLALDTWQNINFLFQLIQFSDKEPYEKVKNNLIRFLNCSHIEKVAQLVQAIDYLDLPAVMLDASLTSITHIALESTKNDFAKAVEMVCTIPNLTDATRSMINFYLLKKMFSYKGFLKAELPNEKYAIKLAVAPEGSFLFTGGDKVWDIASIETRNEYEDLRPKILPVSYSTIALAPKDQRIFTNTNDKDIHEWKLSGTTFIEKIAFPHL